jgi:arylsulfatase A-like enzyme
MSNGSYHVNESPRRANLVFVFADQMRGMDMGCAGNSQVRTPELDAFRREGIYVPWAFANTPVCCPSRASLLTGQYPTAHRVIANDLPLPETAVTLGELLDAAGYHTAYIGKWHLDGMPRDRFTPPGPRRHGFRTWRVFNCSHNYMQARYFGDEPEAEAIVGYEPQGQTDMALAFLHEQARARSPFALFLSWGPPHDPYHMVPEEYRALYDPQQIELRSNFQPIAPGPRDISRGFDPRRTLADYYAAITALDEQFGRLLHALDEFDLRNDTIVVFTSDHGDMLWSHGRMKKQQPWEESIRIPFLLRWPGRIPANSRSGVLLSMVDIAPTLLGLLGLPIPAAMQGSNLAAALAGDDCAGPESVFLQEYVSCDESWAQGLPEWRGVRSSRYTYVRCVGEDDAWLLYDNQNDPYQLVNLARDPAYAAIREEHEAMLRQWLEATADPFCSGLELIERLDLVRLWNERERLMHRHRARLLSEPA